MPRASQARLNKTLMNLSLDAPQVIAARALKFYQPGAMMSARNQAEFTRMFTEKQAAATESYMSLMMNAATMYQQMMFGYMSMLGGGKSTAIDPSEMVRSMNDALKPYQRRASANARRLGGRRRMR